MNILFVLIPISLILLLVMIGMFIWAVRKGQFEDLDAAAIDILSDEAPPPGEPAPDETGTQPPAADHGAPPEQDRHAD